MTRKQKLSAVGLLLLILVVLLGWWKGRAQPTSTALTMQSTTTAASAPNPTESIDVPQPSDASTKQSAEIATEQPSTPTTAIPQPKKPATPAVREYAIQVIVTDSAKRAMDPLKLSLVVEDDKGASWPIVPEGSWYTARRLHEGRFAVSARSDGYQSQRVNVELTRNNPAALVELVIRSATTLMIKVLTEDGHDLAEQVSAEPETWIDSLDRPRIIDGFPPFDSAAVIPVATREKPGNRLPETSLKNHSRFGAGIYRGWGSPYTHTSPRHLDENADEDIPPGYTGVLELFEPLPLYVSATVRNVVIETKLVPEGAREVTFNISLDQVKSCFGEAHLRVIDALTELPLKDCVVSFAQRGVSGGGSPVDRQGEIVFQHVQPGPVELHIIARDHESINETVRIEPGKLNDFGTYRLQPAISIQGVVLDPNGQPATLPTMMSLVSLEGFDPNQLITDIAWGSYTENGVSWSTFNTDESGRFWVMNVHRGKYLLRLDLRERSAPCLLVVDTTGGSVEGLRLQAVKGTKVTFHFDRDAGEDDWLRVFDAEGLPVCEVDAMGSSGWEDGRRATRLAQGAYKCAVFSKGSRLTTMNVEVGSAPITIEVPH